MKKHVKVLDTRLNKLNKVRDLMDYYFVIMLFAKCLYGARLYCVNISRSFIYNFVLFIYLRHYLFEH